MDIRQEKFNKENKPFYMVDHEDGIYMNYIEWWNKYECFLKQMT